MINFAHVPGVCEEYVRGMQWPYPSRLLIESEHPFVGRKAELEAIEAAWALVEEGRRQVIFIGGEPGAGKTRLIAETATAIHDNDNAVLFGSSFSDYALPYQLEQHQDQQSGDHQDGHRQAAARQPDHRLATRGQQRASFAAGWRRGVGGDAANGTAHRR
jgi:hypothetical protein